MERLHFPRITLTCAALAACSFAAHGQEVLTGIAAEVVSGGQKEVVTFGDVRELIGSKEKQARDTLHGTEMIETIKAIRTAAINDLIDRALIIQDFKAKGFTIPEYFIDERVAAIIKDEFGGDRAAFLRTLAAQGLTLDKFREFQRNMIIVAEMRKQVIKSVVTTVSDARINEYYKAHAAEYSQPEQIKLRLIAIRGADDGRRKFIEEIRQKIVEGAEFGDLAKLYSDDSAQENYGDWGWIDRKKLNESLTKAAFALKAGEVSPVIEQGGSLYLLHCEAKKAASVKPLSELRSAIENAVLQNERQQLQEEWLQKLRRKAYVKVF